MELKVWVEGIQRIVCGVTDKTTCQDVVYALAHATGKTGRFTLIERWRNNERLLAPQEHPLKVLSKWGEYSQDVQFILQRSPLDNSKSPGSPQMQRAKASPSDGKQDTPPPSQNGPQLPGHIKKSNTFSGQLHHLGQAAIWKTPPSNGTKHPPPVVNSISTGNLNPLKNPLTGEPARLSPDSGRGSDPTGSDTSNFSDQEKARSGPRTSQPIPPSGYQPQGYPDPYPNRPGGRFHSQSPDRAGETAYGYSKPRSGSNPPPAYRPPPHPGQGNHARNSSPADPPPYRNPPPPPGSNSRQRGPLPTSPTLGRHCPPSPNHGGLPPPHPNSSSPMGHNGPQSPGTTKSHQFVRPHYSPPPHHRDIRGHPRGPSPGRSFPNRVQGSPSRGPFNPQSPSRGHAWGSRQPHALRPSPSGDSCNKLSMQQDGLVPTNDNYVDLMNLVSAQQTRLQSQHAEIKHCDNELSYWDRGLVGAAGPPTGPGSVPQSVGPGRPWGGGPRTDPPSSQLDAVLTEVKRLEEVAGRNDRELNHLGSPVGGSGGAGGGPGEGGEIRSELDQLKHRLDSTDSELQKTNMTLRRLGDEMRSFSQEKSRQKEDELRIEVERIQAEIKLLQKSSEDGANISEKLNKEVQDVENQISARKAEVEKLIQDMKSANLESLTISPPDESKAFLDGPSKPGGTTRKMMGSPRQLENAVPTSKNPHGVWV